MADPVLTDVRGIGPRTADGLAARGLDSIAAVAAAPPELIATLPGFSMSRARAVQEAAAVLAASAAPAPSRVAAKRAKGRAESSAEPAKEKKTKKSKKNKKSKKK